MESFKRGFSKVGVIVAVAALSACGGMEIESAKKMKPEGSAFSKSLYGGYVKLSQSEFDEADYEDSDAFAMRAKTAAGGNAIQPEDIAARALPKNKVGELSSARARLMAALEAGAATKAPNAAANAQVMFDCWMQEQEENFQPSDIARCRGDFMTALAKAEAAVVEKPMAKKMPAPKPMAKPAPKRQKFVVYFPFDSTKITPSGQDTIMSAIDAAKKFGAKRVFVAGHTDRAGADKYNAALSDMRAQAVVKAMTGGGLSGRLVSFGSFGENIPMVATKDGVRASGNRRVEIEISN